MSWLFANSATFVEHEGLGVQSEALGILSVSVRGIFTADQNVTRHGIETSCFSKPCRSSD